MDGNNKSSKLRTTSKVLWRVVFSFRAMHDTATLAKKEVQRIKDSLVALKDIGNEIRKTAADGSKSTKPARNDTFEKAMKHRSKNALSPTELYTFFLSKKRMALGAAACFALLSLYGVLQGIWYGHGLDIVLGALSLLASQPVFFIVALGAQLRLWQLRTRRLSKKEKGSLRDFMREVNEWWWVTLDPEWDTRRK